ncbi:MAG: thioredoxin-dependent thiol peroxidase [Tannerella sp.]|jgi:peroxiredoxin Q/BCP|nr:thioredoxin-dependent thiol peroxidase [Tannerella sp.]
MAIRVGDKAPEILGYDQNGIRIKLSRFRGKKLAIYFYPKDNTGGCTAEACSLRDGYGELQKAGYEVLGVSRDSAKSHRLFIEQHNLPFNLIVDMEARLHEQFGVLAEKTMFGHKYTGTRRQTFLIDENGVVEKIIEKVNTKDHARQILMIQQFNDSIIQ